MSVRRGENIIAGTPKIDVIDDLTTASPDLALSANQGKVLKESIDEIKAAQDSIEVTTEEDILDLFK